ncbi:thioesterase family protein [Paraliomyxa miuraensis]|uniref:thioesterase family protein n=1 Tax=Paraliomyxa miuraensis TaxID=376150 RepID=UPI00225AA3A0|nr:thioesterase family protein [Paraliomyxa miuraensis]MCX4246210.1 thioesterase family protein [Paraliomyxa miuraensis]
MTDSALSPERQRLLQHWFEQGIPFNRFLGIRLHRLERGRCVLMLPWRDELVGDASRPAVHGGVISTLIDTAGGGACFSSLDRTEDRISTVDLRVDYLRPGGAADLWCDAEVVRMGNRVGVTRMALYSGALPAAGEPSRPIATGQGVYNIVRRSEE